MRVPVLDDLLDHVADGWRLRVNTAFHLTVGPTWGFAERRNHDCHLLYVEAGAGTYRLAGRSLALRAGLLLFVAPGLAITATADPRRLPRIVPLRFDAVAADGGTWRGRPIAVHAQLPEQAGRCAELAALHGGGPLAEVRQHGHLVEILVALRERAGGAVEPEPSPLETLCRSLRTHPDQRPAIAALARRAGLSEKHFIRAFRRHTGLTPHAFLVRARIDQAVFLLAETTLSVAAIADQLGYPDQAALSRQFRQVRGCAPSAWRGGHSRNAAGLLIAR